MKRDLFVKDLSEDKDLEKINSDSIVITPEWLTKREGQRRVIGVNNEKVERFYAKCSLSD